jgi:hypothetical protein
MSLDRFWAGYDATLARVRAERPDTLEGLAAILNAFESPSSGTAFFGNNADDHLEDALESAGWHVRMIDGDYLWNASHPVTGAEIHYVEGDVYPGRWKMPR